MHKTGLPLKNTLFSSPNAEASSRMSALPSLFSHPRAVTAKLTLEISSHQAVANMVKKACEFLEQTPDKATMLKLLETLRTVTAGKVGCS